MNDLMLMSNSYSPGLGALEHAMDALAELFASARHVLFVPYAGSNPDAYTEAMRQMNYQVDGQHRAVREVAKDFLDSAP